MSEKRSDFLWLVQMIMHKHEDQIVGWSGIAGDAVAASHRIPRDVTARDAALDFCAFFVPGFHGETRGECPPWMVNLKDPQPSVYETRGIRTV